MLILVKSSEHEASAVDNFFVRVITYHGKFWNYLSILQHLINYGNRMNRKNLHVLGVT